MDKSNKGLWIGVGIAVIVGIVIMNRKKAAASTGDIIHVKVADWPPKTFSPGDPIETPIAISQKDYLISQIQMVIMNNAPYDASLDLNHDGVVDILDLTLAEKMV